MKKTKIIVPALAMLLLGTAASVTGTVAWFSVSTTANVTGMTVKTKVQSNMLIAGDTIGSTAKLADENFSGQPLVQEVSDILEPASTSNAINYFYTVDAKADGSAKALDAFVAYNASTAATDTTNYLNKFSEDYGLKKTDANALISGKQGAVAYVEYVYQLKVVNTSTNASYINLKTLELSYTQADSESDDEHAFRVAIFCQSADSTISALAAGDKVGTWKPTAGADFNSKVVSGTNTLADSAYVSSATSIATVAASSTHYYKIVARMWIEGQDNSCKNDTFAALTGEWALEMELELEDAVGGVTAITMA